MDANKSPCQFSLHIFVYKLKAQNEVAWMLIKTHAKILSYIKSTQIQKSPRGDDEILKRLKHYVFYHIKLNLVVGE